MTVTLPETLQYGKVVGRFVLAVADVPEDPDSLPNAVPAVGTITFTSAAPLTKEYAATPPTTVVRSVISGALDNNGYLYNPKDPTGPRGIWLVAGLYKVSYALNTGAIAGHDILVLPEHDDETPLDLISALPPGGPILTASQYAELTARMDILEAGGGGVTDHGDLNGLSDPDAHPMSSITGLVTALSDKADDTDLIAHASDTTSVHGIADTSALVITTDPRLSNARTPTAHIHDDRYFTEAETTAALAGKANTSHTQNASTITDLTEAVQDIVGAFIVGGTNVTVTYNDVANTFTINATAETPEGTDPEVVRDVIGAALVAGSGIQITVNDAGDTITVASTAVLPTRQVNSGTGLSGGGDLSANRTLSVNYGTTSGTAAQGNDSRIVNAVPNTRTVAGKQLNANITIGAADLSATGTKDGTTVLHGDNTWKVPAGGGGGGGGGAESMQGGPVSGSLLLQPVPIASSCSGDLNGHTSFVNYPILRPVTIDALAVRTTGAVTGATVQIALYDSTPEGLPGSRVALTAQLPAEISALNIGLLETPLLLEPGLYWTAVYGLGGWFGVGTGFQVNTSGAGVSAPVGWYRQGDPWAYNGYRAGYNISGPPPETFPTSGVTGGARSSAFAWVRAL